MYLFLLSVVSCAINPDRGNSKGVSELTQTL